MSKNFPPHFYFIFLFSAILNIYLAGSINVALNKPAIHSGPYLGDGTKYQANYSVDGNFTTYSFSDTKESNKSAYWIVDLQGIYLIKGVVVTAPTHYYQYLESFQVIISLTNSSGQALHTFTCAEFNVDPTEIRPLARLNLPCQVDDVFTANLVAIQRFGGQDIRYLALAEVEVDGTRYLEPSLSTSSTLTPSKVSTSKATTTVAPSRTSTTRITNVTKLTKTTLSTKSSYTGSTVLNQSTSKSGFVSPDIGEGLGPGAVAGIVVGVLVGLLIIIVILIVIAVCTRRKRGLNIDGINQEPNSNLKTASDASVLNQYHNQSKLNSTGSSDNHESSGKYEHLQHNKRDDYYVNNTMYEELQRNK